ncbi:uncharacterized protein LOC133174376 [Saccostrea echinata]|uniref:uncharacterized protein LOC133174376 n=1 Tax=Saccostrea echinata TaxID=191078 RepID=UPI002A80E459|nr:uncharacterized protein LOC133174376 [Saccostrea echinata]XP_061165477.1 uncharacterized protein LOC133174376 [Saccostrea echinata]
MPLGNKNSDGNTIWIILKKGIDIILFLLGLGWMIIGAVILGTISSNSDINKILNIITILSNGVGDDIKILSVMLIVIGGGTMMYAVFGFVLFCIKEEKKNEIPSRWKTMHIIYPVIGVLLIVSTIVVLGLWSHIRIKFEEDDPKIRLLENMRTYFTSDVVGNTDSFPNSWNKLFMELDCCAINPVFSKDNDFDPTPWCRERGECQQTNSEIPKTCCKGVTVNTYASAPSDCHASVDSGTYNSKGCYEVLRNKIDIYPSAVIGVGVPLFIFGIVAVFLFLKNVLHGFNNSAIDPENQ